jgi:hypothetical protein
VGKNFLALCLTPTAIAKSKVLNYHPSVHKLRRPRVFAPVLHVCLFALTWLLYWVQPQPLAQGPADWPFRILFVADLPISIIAFGMMFNSDARFPLALALWGVLGTAWWYFLGCLMERRARRS